jgi:hypothetical protein
MIMKTKQQPAGRQRDGGASRSDFLFTGLGVLPPALAYWGHFDAALLISVPMLIAACLAAASERELPGGSDES